MCNAKKRNASSHFPVAGAQCWPCRRWTVSVASLLASLILPCVLAQEAYVLALAPWHSSQTCLFCAQKHQEENEITWSLGFQLISGSRCLFDAADRSGFVRLPLCQIKGQRLDGEATLFFLVVQPRERPNKSGGNVVTGELERSLPTGRGK